MAWFNFLKSEGYFDPENNPEPVHVKDGFQIPHWEALTYLEKLSLQIKDGNELELTNELLSVIKNVSENPKDNYRTWYLFIKILSNIPKELISKDVLKFIPVWFSGKFDTMLQTSELCEKLLPKFLGDSPTNDDIEKAELILHYLFQIEKVEVKQQGIWDEEVTSYRSRAYLHFISEYFVRKNLISKITKYCSNNFILELGRSIKYLLLDYPNGIQSIIKDVEKEYEIKIFVDDKNLLVSSKLKGTEDAFATSTLLNYEYMSEDVLKQELSLLLQKQNINYISNNEDTDTFKRLNFALNNDLTSAYGFNSIRKLDDKYSSNGKVLDVFSLIFRDLLNEKAKQNPKEAIALLNTFCFDNNYRIPFYKRIALYVVSENWNETKSIFWDLIKDIDASHLFSNYKFQKEVYELLDKNQLLFSEEEKAIIQNIINKGDQEHENDNNEKHLEYWQLRWFAAMKDIEPFRNKYLQLSKSLNITNEHFENLGEIRVRSGSISPISIDELLEKSISEISEYINSFNPTDNWEEPDIGGLSETFGSAVESQPERFAEEIELFNDIGYIYSYRLLNGFSNAWKKKVSFNWEKVLQYCLQTLKSEKFYSGQLKLENDTWSATAEWVVGSVANLLTDGLKDDNNAFDIELLPLAKEIIQILATNLKPVDDFKGTNMDYPTYSLNSTAGKVLRALFDYSLRRARNYFKYEDKGKWEPDMQVLFENTLKNGILDGHILEGMYFEQFYFLDRFWITEQVKQHYKASDRDWHAFMGGFAFANAPFNKEIYSLFYPHYDKAIENNLKLKSFHSNGLVRHLTAFYFRGYESLNPEALIFKFLNTTTPDGVQDLISFIWRQENYPRSLTEVEQNNFRNIILELWTYITNKYENSESEEEQKILASLIHWVVFAPELNETYASLILKSSKHIDKTYSTHELLKYLVLLKNKTNTIIDAKYLAEILTSIQFTEYISDSDRNNIIELVSYLFEHNQKEIAINFCNNMAVKQYFFLRETYESYVSKINN